MNAQTVRQEAVRKALHLSTVVLPLWMRWMPPPWSWRGPVLAFLIVLAVDLLRLRWGPVRARLGPLVVSYLRPDERRGLISVHYLTGAAALLACTVPPAVGATAVGYLVLGDAAAALVGRRFGRHRLGTKTLEGSAACFACCLVLGALWMPGRWLAVLGGALTATIVEALPLGVDDNLSVPLVAAAVLLGLG